MAVPFQILQGGLIGFWIAFAVSAALAIPVLRTLIKLKSRQTVSEYVPEHAAKQGTPTMGGLIIVAGALAAEIWFSLTQSGGWGVMAPYLVLLLGFAAIGFVDDFLVPRMMPAKRGLGWKQKFGLEIVVGGIAMALAARGDPWGICVGTFLILFYSNAFNFADGMDAMSSGVGIFFLGALAVIGLLCGAPLVTTLSVALIGGILPFLFLNAPPARVFMGDVGSLPIGASMGLMVWEITRSAALDKAFEVGGGSRWTLFLALAVLSLVLTYELIPVPLQIASVKLRKKRMFLMTPIHHAFQKKGVPETRVVWGFIVAQIVVSALAVTIALFSLPGGSAP